MTAIRIAGTALVATLALSVLPAQADPTRGWRAGADAFGNSDTQRIAHYSSPGLLPSDKATISFGISGHFPISLFNLMSNFDVVQDGFNRLGADYPEELQSFREDCMVNTGSFMMGNEKALCIMEQVYADATLELTFVVDVSDMHYSGDPVTNAQSIGVKHAETGAYVPSCKVRRDRSVQGQRRPLSVSPVIAISAP